MSMTKHITLGIIAGAMAALPFVARAEEAAKEESELSASASLPILSAYVWRGQVLNDEAVLQPTFGITKGGFNLFWWGNFNLTDQATGDADEFSEHDVGASYTFTCPVTGAGVTLGLVNYDFPNPSVDAAGTPALVSDTREAQLTFALGDVILSPTLFVAYDFKEADGFYGSLAISHSIELAETLSLNASASIGYADSDYNSYYFGVDDSAFNDATFGLTLPIAACENWTITPGVQYVMLVDNKIEDAAVPFGYKDKDQVVGSLTATYAF